MSKKKVLRLFLRSRSKSGTITIRRSGMLRSYRIGSRTVNTFCTACFLRLTRSCRVVEKFDKNHRFFTIFCGSGPEKRSIGSDFSATRHDLCKRRKQTLSKCIGLHACEVVACHRRIGVDENNTGPEKVERA